MGKYFYYKYRIYFRPKIRYQVGYIFADMREKISMYLDTKYTSRDAVASRRQVLKKKDLFAK